MNRTHKVISTTVAALLLACNSTIDRAGIQGSGSPQAVFVRGPVTGFGSIFVNGVEYSTADASVMVDDQPGSEAELHAGQIVTIQGTVNPDGTTGTANQVSFSGDVQGPATQIDSASNTFVVLGQTVHVTGSTLYDDTIQPADLTGLKPGTAVEVSGLTDANGEIVATRVDLASMTTPLRVVGAVEDLDTAAHTFRVNALTVDYGSASVSSATMLSSGALVAIQGVAAAGSSELIATRIDAAPGLGASKDQLVDVTGIITGVTSLLEFTLQGQPVLIDLNTHLVLHGIPLGLNVEVDVKGALTSSGALLAKKIEVKPRSGSLVKGLASQSTE
ncbi:MAG TPA: DUF5666 domain-containing protein [Chloroflexota bacterium]